MVETYIDRSDKRVTLHEVEPRNFSRAIRRAKIWEWLLVGSALACWFQLIFIDGGVGRGSLLEWIPVLAVAVTMVGFLTTREHINASACDAMTQVSLLEEEERTRQRILRRALTKERAERILAEYRAPCQALYLHAAQLASAGADAELVGEVRRRAEDARREVNVTYGVLSKAVPLRSLEVYLKGLE